MNGADREMDSAGRRIGDRPLLVVLNGVNLGMLGTRPVAHYGSITLAELERMVESAARDAGWRCACHQTDHEGEFVQLAHRYRDEADALLVNPGAWTHYSYAIRDALELVNAPIAEVHLSDIESRESWRRLSVIADLAALRVWGEGPEGYIRAARTLFATHTD
jgi:3-dehydroquinate dehydratase-2